jgi:RNA polymerase sigma-70 factor (ECF subfamily)
MSDSSMHDLAARLARGEEAAFAELYDAAADRLHNYLTGRLGSREAASDVLQTAFLRIVRSRRRLRGVANPAAYLFQVARNEAIRTAARCGRASEQPLAAAEFFADCENAFERADDVEAIAAALARLDTEDREILELKVYGGLTFREIAEVVDRPQATVATRYRRALESLRPMLARQYR